MTEKYDPSAPGDPRSHINYRDTRGWLAGIAVFIVCVLALIGLVAVFAHFTP